MQIRVLVFLACILSVVASAEESAAVREEVGRVIKSANRARGLIFYTLPPIQEAFQVALSSPADEPKIVMLNYCRDYLPIYQTQMLEMMKTLGIQSTSKAVQEHALDVLLSYLKSPHFGTGPGYGQFSVAFAAIEAIGERSRHDGIKRKISDDLKELKKLPRWVHKETYDRMEGGGLFHSVNTVHTVDEKGVPCLETIDRLITKFASPAPSVGQAAPPSAHQ